MKRTQEIIDILKNVYGFKNKDIAERLGVPISTVKEYERGTKRMTSLYRNRLMKVYNSVTTVRRPPKKRTARSFVGDYSAEIVTKEPTNTTIDINYIEQIRREKGITQSDISKSLKLSDSAYGAWVKRGHIPPQRVKDICDILGVEIHTPRKPDCKRLRVELGMNKCEFAELLGCDDTTVGEWERWGQHIPQSCYQRFLNNWNKTFGTSHVS